MGKKGQQIIKDDNFKTVKSLTVNEAKRLTCSEKGECTSLVENWDQDSPLFVPVLELSNDNERVTNASVVLKGKVYAETKWIQGAKLWDMEEAIQLKISEIDLSLFKFGGALQSEMLDHTRVDYSFHKKKGEEIEPEAIQLMGFEGFSLRAFIIPTSGAISKLLITIYPFPVESLEEIYPHSKNPRFPCISASEMDIDMGIVASTILDDPVGSPILPGIIPGSPLSRVPNIPNTPEIISRLSSLMRTALLPELRSSRSALFNRYDSIEEKGPENLKSVALENVWPEPEPVVNNSDRSLDDQDEEVGSVLSVDDRSENGLLNDVYQDFEGSDERSSVYESEPELRAKKASGERKKGSSIGKPNKKTLRNNGDRSNIEKGKKKRKSKSLEKKSLKKKRAKLYNQSSESDVEITESGSSSEEDDSNWHILSQIWPVSDRPPALQNRRVVNNKSMEELTAIFKMKSEKDKLEGSGEISVDAKQPTIVFPKKSDDGQSKLHPARWLRLPTSDPSTWCSQVPLKTTPIIRHMALGYSGSQNMVPNKTVEVLHDRSKPLLLKYFHPSNLNVAGKGKKDIFSLEDGILQKTQDMSWETPQSLQQLQECLVNYALLNQQLHPWDPTALMLWRLLVKYRWISATDDYSTRRGVITSLFEAVSRTNASRACNGFPPMSFKDQEDCLKEVLVKSGVSPDIPLPSIRMTGGGSQAGQSQSGRGARGGYRGQSTRGGSSGRGSGRGRGGFNSGRDQSHSMPNNSRQICYGYNTLDNRPCNKTRTNDGCTDGIRSFTHLCNKILPGGAMCLQKHPKSLHPA